jgi:CelD/BcsL family acetyltransferase involved in cellulose biosynthesis
MTFRLRISTSHEDLARIAPAWDDLAAATGGPTNTAAWYRAAARWAHQPTDRLHVLSLWQSQALVGLAPLILACGPAGWRYEIIGARLLCEPTAVITRDRSAAEGMAQAVAALKHPVMLARLPTLSEFNPAFERLARQVGVILPPDISGSQWIDLSCGWERHYQDLSSGVKDMIRRGERELAKLGKVEFDCICPAPDAVESILEQAFQVERHSWKGRAGTAVLLCEDVRRFYLDYGLRSARRGELRVAFLRLDGQPVAMQVASINHGAYWTLKVGYDERYKKCQTGWQLRMRSIRWAAEQGLKRYECLGSEEQGVTRWTNHLHRYVTLRFYPFSVPGLQGFVHDGLRSLRHKWQATRHKVGTACFSCYCLNEWLRLTPLAA